MPGAASTSRVAGRPRSAAVDEWADHDREHLASVTEVPRNLVEVRFLRGRASTSLTSRDAGRLYILTDAQQLDSTLPSPGTGAWCFSSARTSYTARLVSAPSLGCLALIRENFASFSTSDEQILSIEYRETHWVVRTPNGLLLALVVVT